MSRLLPRRAVLLGGAALSVAATSAPAFFDLAQRPVASDIRALEDFGARADCVPNAGFTAATGTDNSAAFQAAFDWMSAAPDRGLVAAGGQSGIYLVTKGVSTLGNVDLDMAGTMIFVASSTNLFTCSARLFGPYKLRRDYQPGSDVLDMGGMDNAPLPNQPVRIVSDAVDPGNRDEGKRDAQFRVGEYVACGPGTDAKAITLADPLQFTTGVNPVSGKGDEDLVPSYTTSMNARVVWADPRDRCEIRNLTIRYEEGHAFREAGDKAWTGRCLRLVGYVQPRIVNCHVLRGYQQFINVSCFSPEIVDCSASRLENDTKRKHYGYGVADACSWGTLVTNFRADDVRHAYTSSAFTARADDASALRSFGLGRTQYAQIVGGSATGGRNGHWDTHHSTDTATFYQVASRGVDAAGIALRGRQNVVVSPQVRQAKQGVFVFTEWDSGDPADDIYTAGKRAQDLTSAHVLSPDISCSNICLSVSAATLRLGGQGVYTNTDSPAWLVNSGGVVDIEGTHSVMLRGMAPATVGETPSDGIIIARAVNKRLQGTFDMSVIRITGEVEIDARERRGALTLFDFQSAPARIEVAGRLVVRLPDGAAIRRGKGTVETVGGGRITVYQGGARTDL